jgi:hypothetical protein
MGISGAREAGRLIVNNLVAFDAFGLGHCRNDDIHRFFGGPLAKSSLSKSLPFHHRLVKMASSRLFVAVLALVVQLTFAADPSVSFPPRH